MRLSIQLGGSLAILFFAVACEAKPSPAGGEGKPAEKKAAASAPKTDEKKADKPKPSASDIDEYKKMAAQNLKLHVPPPSDLIRVISKLQSGGKKINLAPHVTQMAVDEGKSKSKQAFAAGILVTQFFIYAEGKNKSEAARVAKTLGEAAKRLVPDKEKIAQKGEAIATSIDNSNWDKAMMGVDEVYAIFKEDLGGEGGTKEGKVLAQYIALGAWAESLYVLSAYMDKSYDEEVSKYMRQASLAKELSKQLLQNDTGAFAKTVDQAVKGVDAQVSVGKNDPIPQNNVKKIYKILKAMRSQA